MKILESGIAVIEWDTHISKWIEETGRIDHDETIEKYLLPLINEGDVVVDAGANIGSHTIPYAQKVSIVGKVYAFEVNPSAITCLSHNANAYSWIKIIPMGLSDRFERPMLCASENVGASFLKPGIFAEEVECVPLDSIELDRLNFFKIDCEGYELYVLRGAWRTIQRCKPIMFIEINVGALDRNKVKSDDIINFLELLGYAYVKHGGGDDQYDLICTPRVSVTQV